MLEPALAGQLKAHLERITFPIALQASLDDSAKSVELRDLLTEVAEMSELVTYELTDDADRRPSFAIRRLGTEVEVRFAGIPMGHEFTSFVLALLQVGGVPPKVSEEVAVQVQGLDGDFRFETYMSLSCVNCPDVVQALNAMSVLNPRIRPIAIDGGVFPQEIEDRQIMAVPTVYLNGELFGSGRMTLDEIVGRLDSGAAAKEGQRLSGKEPFEVLVVGGGPAGASAAIYAGRKGIRTGLVAERFGGQVLDTMAIENLVSVTHTEGPKLAVDLERHVREYDVDLMNAQTAVRLDPPEHEGGLFDVHLANGGVLRSRSVVVAPGARWRLMNVPGEEDYRNRGVTFCPHCDGPLFKGKRVAVIGGGNSGVEAAIDLAGIVGHVTVIEFDSQLRADEVLQRKLRSLPNVDIVTSAHTQEVVGDGAKVTGLRVKNRETDEMFDVAVDGVFVQIGLVPSTEWLKGTLDLTSFGEIVVDGHGRTSVPGLFAAGDGTTEPFKQIVTALGSGATASLSAFDYLIRTSELTGASA